MEKSKGVTETERMLAEFGDRTFLRLWSYANPHKDDGHEMCDLIAVFGDDVFIFFDREVAMPEDGGKDPAVVWERWKRNVIDRQIMTAHGVERYIRMGRPIYLDAKKEHPFQIPIDVSKATFHKVIVAHGAKDACKRASPDNVYGSLAILYADPKGESPSFPFFVQIDRNRPVHVLDSHNLSILLGELDTVTDFSNYLHEKLRAIERFNCVLYCGEEDLLAHYLSNSGDVIGYHIIGPPTSAGESIGLNIEEGGWASYIETDTYKGTKEANKISYGWDELIQRTCQNSLNGTLLGNTDISKGDSAIFEMVKEPRFMRRVLSEQLIAAAERFPDVPEGAIVRNVTLLSSFQSNVAYVFLQLAAPDGFKVRPDYRSKRQTLLQIACGAAKNKFPDLVKIVGIAIDAPKYSDGRDGEDFVLMICETWSDQLRRHFEEQNKHVRFFASSGLRARLDPLNEFVKPPLHNTIQAMRLPKVGRNEPCPCGSGKKFKKCHGAGVAP